MNAFVAHWQRVLARRMRNRACAAMLFLGFSSGLPFPLVLTTLSARLRSGRNRPHDTSAIFSLVGLAYSLKFFWSPIVDRLRLPMLGTARPPAQLDAARANRYRDWSGRTRVHRPGEQSRLPSPGSPCSQPSVRRHRTSPWMPGASKSSPLEWQGSMAAAYQIGYQMALIAGGAGALFAASGYGWTMLIFMACAAGVGIATTFADRRARSDHRPCNARAGSARCRFPRTRGTLAVGTPARGRLADRRRCLPDRRFLSRATAGVSRCRFSR